MFSDSDDDRPTKRQKTQKAPARNQFMSFVSSGAAKNDSDSGSDDDAPADPRSLALTSDSDDDDDDYDDDAGFGGLGMGLGASTGSSMGFQPASFSSSAKDKAKDKAATSTTSYPFSKPAPPKFQPPSFQPPSAFGTASGLGASFVPSSAYDPTLRNPDEGPTKPAVVARPSAFSGKPASGKKGGGGGGGGGGAAAPNKMSFAARMMAKMGHVEGQGLGKDGQGRSTVIEVTLRPQGAGVGVVKEKSEAERQQEKRQRRLAGEDVSSSEDERKTKERARRAAKPRGLASGASGASGVSTPRRAKTKYMTLDEAKKAAPGLHISDAFTSILDMTGREQKLITSSSGLMTPGGSTPASAQPTAAQQAEARRQRVIQRERAEYYAILDEAQRLQGERALKAASDAQTAKELAGVTGRSREHARIAEAVGALTLNDDAWQPQWDATVAQLQVLQKAYAGIADEVLAHQPAAADIAVAALHPLFKRAMNAWSPLASTNQRLVDGLLAVQGLLGIVDDADAGAGAGAGARSVASETTRSRRRATATAYEQMVYQMWLPVVSAAVREWDVVRDTDSILGLYEAWRPVLPGFVRAQLVDHDIVRRLEGAVAKWEPKRRSNNSSISSSSRYKGELLPHLWLFPWLMHLPVRHVDPASADGLVAQVKRKFRQLVGVWEYYRGVVPGLAQWKTVLRSSSSSHGSSAGQDQWRPLVMAHIVPSMARYVRAQFRVDPWDQGPYLEVVTGVFQWLQLLAPELVGEVLVAEVFPMWHATLYALLTGTAERRLSLEQLAQWLEWWATEVFPPKIVRLASVQAELARGLAMVNEALDLCRDGPGAYDYDVVREHLAPPTQGIARSSLAPSRSHGDRRRREDKEDKNKENKEDKDKDKDKDEPATAADLPDMSIRTYVEDWCEQHEVQFLPERKRMQADGRPLYRLTERGDGRGGVLVYFKGVRMYVETKKGAVEVRVDREGDWTKLLQMIR